MGNESKLIHVTVGGYLAFFAPRKQRAFEVPAAPGLDLLDLLSGLGIPIPEVALMVVNGEVISDLGWLVSAGDQVKFFSASDGG